MKNTPRDTRRRETRRPRLVVLLPLLALLAGPLAARAERLVVPLSDPSKPAWVEAGLVRGSIFVEVYDGREVIVEAEPGAMEKLKEEPKPRADGLRRIPNTSLGMTVEEDDNRVEVSVQSWQRRVDLRLKVPKRTSLKLRTVNDGVIEVAGVNGELELKNVNGEIKVRAVSGSVIADSVNGNVEVDLDQLTPGKPMAFSSLNGDVVVSLPPSLKADLRMRSDHGEILTDFDIDVSEQPPTIERQDEDGGYRLELRDEVYGQVNGGGPEIFFKSFNGDIVIRKKG